MERGKKPVPHRYHLVLWKEPRTRTSRSAEAALHAGSLAVGTDREYRDLAEDLRDQTRGRIALERQGRHGLLLRLSETDLAEYASIIRHIARARSYVLFDPQTGTQIVPSTSARAWPPEWALPDQLPLGSADAQRRPGPGESSGRGHSEPTSLLPGHSGIGDAAVVTPFAPPGLVLPALVPEWLRTEPSIRALRSQLAKRRPESRRLAAIQLVGWTRDPRATALLRERVTVDDDAMVRGIAALGLAASNQTTVADVLRITQEVSSQGRAGRSPVGPHDPVEEGLAYLGLAAAVAARHPGDAQELSLMWARLEPIVAQSNRMELWEGLREAYGDLIARSEPRDG